MLAVIFGVLTTMVLFLLGGGASTGTGFDLVFVGLPQALPAGLSGVLIGTLVYGLLVVMSLTSAVVLLEVVTRFAMERWRHTRIDAATTSAAVIWALGVACLWSFSGPASLDAEQFSLFDALIDTTGRINLGSGTPDFVVPDFVVEPMVASLRAQRLSYTAWAGMPDLRRAVFGQARGYSVWAALLRYPARVGAVVIVLDAIGVFKAIRALWF